ncbi:hypothetical protein [Aestuariivita boseongensis]|uniref:hypothetical protein n=1 Tax=Aestuariivita boseongensis TaxID=1470562 RepID=UPI0006813607|nr:hypothetical protein [Aestuariivita boseongensis]
MSFVRPEARATLWRFREILSGTGLGALGLYLAAGRGLTVWLGYAALVVALGLIVVGFQRTRFRTGGGGPGVVGIDEGQIAYFGPLSGGVMALADMERLTLDPTAQPAHWLLESKEHPPLHIPVNAEGSEKLFDAFAALPGIRTERMLAELRGRATYPVVIWERALTRPVHLRLH